MSAVRKSPPFTCERRGGGALCTNVWQRARRHERRFFAWRVRGVDLKVSSKGTFPKRQRGVSEAFYACVKVYIGVHGPCCNYSKLFMKFAALLSTDESIPVIKRRRDGCSAAVKLP